MTKVGSVSRPVQSLARALFAALLCLAACAETAEPTRAPQVCEPLSFRACDTDACRAVEQCKENGLSYGPCSCVITDASYADAPDVRVLDAATEGDASSQDATPDADAGDASTDGANASEAGDAALDAG